MLLQARSCICGQYLHCSRAQNIPVFLLIVEASEFSTRKCPWAVHSAVGRWGRGSLMGGKNSPSVNCLHEVKNYLSASVNNASNHSSPRTWSEFITFNDSRPFFQWMLGSSGSFVSIFYNLWAQGAAADYLQSQPLTYLRSKLGYTVYTHHRCSKIILVCMIRLFDM